MFLRLTCIYFVFSIFNQVNATPTFGTSNPDSTGGSFLGDVFRAKAQFFDQLKNSFHQKFNVGAGVVSNNVHNLGNSISTSIDATGRLIDSGITAGKEYGKTIFHSAIAVPKTVFDLATACLHHTSYIDANVAQNLAYVDGQPEYLFQYVNEIGQIIPVTAEVANKLVPGLVV